ncbi:MAG: dephospho-CoA kinase [Endomicrobiia bacterium]|nr:dephospho-CoA kinase [Endomicrobiia bacterium]
MAAKNNTAKIPIVGITGLPASGKSTALKVFARAGFRVASADDIARIEFARPRARRSIKKIFGTTSRRRIARAVFSDEKKRRALERIVHPGIIKELQRQVCRARRRLEPFAAEVPLLFEKKLSKLFNTIVTIISPRRLIMGRLASKGISRRTAVGMIRAHLPQARKAAMADIIIRNDGNRKKLSAALKRVTKVISKVE